MTHPTSDLRTYRCDGQVWEHRWSDTYYGTKCEDCGLFYAYGCEPWVLDDSEGDDNDYDDWSAEDEHDEFDEALGNCHAFLDAGHYVCMAAGSEECDECPFNSDLGKTPQETGVEVMSDDE